MYVNVTFGYIKLNDIYLHDIYLVVLNDIYLHNIYFNDIYTRLNQNVMNRLNQNLSKTTVNIFSFHRYKKHYINILLPLHSKRNTITIQKNTNTTKRNTITFQQKPLLLPKETSLSSIATNRNTLVIHYCNFLTLKRT